MQEKSVQRKTVLILGGARSGKSSFAQRMAAEQGGRVCFLATAGADDGEMQERIQRHRRNRPADWLTLELDDGISLGCLHRDVRVVLLDCFTIYVANLMAENGLDWEVEDEDLLSEAEVARLMQKAEREALDMVERLRIEAETLIIVSNEVGTGLVPPFRLGRIFRDLAGRLNQRLADMADEVHMVIAGLPLCLKAHVEKED